MTGKRKAAVSNEANFKMGNPRAATAIGDLEWRSGDSRAVQDGAPGMPNEANLARAMPDGEGSQGTEKHVTLAMKEG